jgi:hypothetical protein
MYYNNRTVACPLDFQPLQEKVRMQYNFEVKALIIIRETDLTTILIENCCNETMFSNLGKHYRIFDEEYVKFDEAVTKCSDLGAR